MHEYIMSDAEYRNVTVQAVSNVVASDSLPNMTTRTVKSPLLDPHSVLCMPSKLTALLLLHVQMPHEEVAKRYGVKRASVKMLQDSAGKFALMVAAFCECLGWNNLDLLISQFQVSASTPPPPTPPCTPPPPPHGGHLLQVPGSE